MLIDLGGNIINTAHIVSMSASADLRGERQWSITFTTGEKVTVPDHPSLSDLVCGIIVPAPAGLTLVEAFSPSPSDDDQRVRFVSTAVLAFRVTSPWAAPEPIGGFGEPVRGGFNYAVLQPDGSCSNWERVWDSLDAFKAAQQADADADARQPPEAPTKPADDRPQTVPLAARDRYEQAKLSPTVPETVEQLRARIQAEPIKSVREKAPWRPGRDFAEVIDEVRKAHPDLHANGLGYSPKWGWKWGPGDQDRAWAEMTEPGNIAAFSAALRFLSHAGRRFPQARVNSKRTSYSWKHVAERVMGVYISNGMLIAAAYALGFTVAPNDTPNPCINLGDKAANLDPQRGL